MSYAYPYAFGSLPTYPGINAVYTLYNSNGLGIENRWYTPNNGIFENGGQTIHMETLFSIQFAGNPDRAWAFFYNSVNGGDGDDTIYGYDDLVDDRVRSFISQNNGDRFFVGIDWDDLLKGGADVQAGGSGNDTLFGQEGDDILYGDQVTSGDSWGAGVTANDVLWGDEGNDFLMGNEGNDTLHGGAGDADTAVYTGALHNYSIVLLNDGRLEITDLRVNTPEGRDTVDGVEKFRFNGVTFNYNEILRGDPPTAVALTNARSSLDENVSTTNRVFIADIVITDDGLGTNTLSLTGTDAARFEIVGTKLYLKAGTVLDFETKTSYSVAVTVDDPAVGGSPDATSSIHTLNINNVQAKISIEGNPANIAGWINAGHLYLVYEDDSGKEYVLRAGNGDGTLTSEGAQFQILLEQSSDARVDLNGDGNITAAEFGNRVLDFGGRDPADVWGVMRQLGQAIDLHNFSYPLIGVGQNSNAFVGSLLSLVGINVETVLPFTNLFFPSRDLDLAFDYAIQGTGRGDILVGRGGGQTFVGNQGQDNLAGGLDNDTLTGGADNDTLDGGDHVDTAKYSGARSNYQFNKINDTTVEIRDTRAGSPDGTDIVRNVENFHFAAGNQTLSFQQLFIVAQLNSTDAADALVMTNNQTAHGLGGNDSITGTGNLNVAFGDYGSDQLYFLGNQNQLFGSEDGDWVGVNGDNNALVGGPGDEVWIGASGMSNTLAGGDGHDALFSYGTGNWLYGEAGNDWLGCSGTQNTLLGGDGVEWMGASGLSNAMGGGDGGDTLFSVGSNVLYGEAGNDWVGCSGNGNVLVGGEGDDYIAASGNSNILVGEGGNDTLVVAAGHVGDLFVFGPGYGRDNAFGFAPHSSGGSDQVEMWGFGLTFERLRDSYMSDGPAGVVITIDAATVLTLHGVTKASITAADFIFA